MHSFLHRHTGICCFKGKLGSSAVTAWAVIKIWQAINPKSVLKPHHPPRQSSRPWPPPSDQRGARVTRDSSYLHHNHLQREACILNSRWCVTLYICVLARGSKEQPECYVFFLYWCERLCVLSGSLFGLSMS